MKDLLEERAKYNKVLSKPSPKGLSFHLLTISFWEGDAGVVVAEIETRGWTSSLLEVWLGTGGVSFDLFYLNGIRRWLFGE